MSQTKAQLIDPVDGTIVNADINASAAIAGSKISPVFTSNVEIINNAPGITFTDSNDSHQFYIQTDGDALNLVDATNSTTKLGISNTGHITLTGNVSINGGYLEVANANLYINENITHAGDGDTRIRFPSNDVISFETAGADRFAIGTNEVVVNDPGNSIDFRVEGDTETNLFFADASAEKIGIGTQSPNARLTVHAGSDNSDVAVLTGGDTARGLKITTSATASTNDSVVTFNAQTASHGTLAFAVANGSEAMRIDSSGLVGVGNASMSSLNASSNDLVVGNGSGTRGITIYSGTSNDGNIFFADGTSGDQHYRGFLQYNHLHDEMRFGSSGDNTLILENASNNRDVHVVDGDIVFDTSGRGLDFSARSGSAAGASSSILYDYEEGTYTPEIGTGMNAGFTYTVQAGHYVKVGRLVRFDFFIQIASGTSNNVMYRITLPFACDTTGTHRGSGAITYVDVASAPVHTPNLYIGSSYAELYAGPTQYKSTAGTAQNGKYIIGGGTFHTAA